MGGIFSAVAAFGNTNRKGAVMIRLLILLIFLPMAAAARPVTGLLEKTAPLPATIPLQVRAPSDMDHAITLTDADGTPVISAYLRGGAVLRLLVPPGDHRMTVASGQPQDWQGLPDMFGTPAVTLPHLLPFRIDGTRREGQSITLDRDGNALRIIDRQNRVVCQLADWNNTQVVETLPSGTRFRYLEQRLDPRSIPCD
ncbi:hypothetical protein [Paracoccus sp. Ld10]|uniref:hypothetical protein n=1 Tax=Paracoccus sp. Ld10 TaxID=649158 RepID=UPI0038688A8F